MRQFDYELMFSVGTPRVQVKLDGLYAKLDSQSDDNVRAATVTSLIQLPLWLQTYMGQADDTGRTSERTLRQDAQTGKPASCKIANRNGTIDVELEIETPRGHIPDELVTIVCNAIGATVQNHADSALIGTPATNDAYVQVQRYLATRHLDMPTQQQLAGSGAHHS